MLSISKASSCRSRRLPGRCESVTYSTAACGNPATLCASLRAWCAPMTAMSSGPKPTIDLSTTSSWSRTTSQAKSRARCERLSTDAFGLDRQLHFVARKHPVARHAECRALQVRRGDERATLVDLAVAVVVGYEQRDRPRDAEHGQFAFDSRGPAAGKYDVLRLVGDLGMLCSVQQRRPGDEFRSRLGVGLERARVDHDVDCAALFGRVEHHCSGRAAEL